MERIIWLLLPVLLLLNGCAGSDTGAKHSFQPENITAETEVISNEAVTVYDQVADRIVLRLAGEPRALPGGYGRLVGVVSGRKMVALLELGGRGLALEEGEKVDDHRVSRITGDQVVLTKVGRE
jgi:hypothetical protein